MDDRLSQEMQTFLEQLVRLNATMKELFASGNVALFTEMNEAIKQMYAVQHASEEGVFVALRPECEVIYANFDMIVKLLRTTQEGVIDAGTQKGLNKLLHNIDAAVVNIASATGLV